MSEHTPTPAEEAKRFVTYIDSCSGVGMVFTHYTEMERICRALLDSATEVERLRRQRDEAVALLNMVEDIGLPCTRPDEWLNDFWTRFLDLVDEAEKEAKP